MCNEIKPQKRKEGERKKLTLQIIFITKEKEKKMF